MKMENKELELKNQVDNLELIDRMLSLLNRIEIRLARNDSNNDIIIRSKTIKK